MGLISSNSETELPQVVLQVPRSSYSRGAHGEWWMLKWYSDMMLQYMICHFNKLINLYAPENYPRSGTKAWVLGPWKGWTPISYFDPVWYTFLDKNNIETCSDLKVNSPNIYSRQPGLETSLETETRVIQPWDRGHKIYISETPVSFSEQNVKWQIKTICRV